MCYARYRRLGFSPQDRDYVVVRVLEVVVRRRRRVRLVIIRDLRDDLVNVARAPDVVPERPTRRSDHRQRLLRLGDSPNAVAFTHRTGGLACRARRRPTTTYKPRNALSYTHFGLVKYVSISISSEIRQR
jgi:hypothetical protein